MAIFVASLGEFGRRLNRVPAKARTKIRAALDVSADELLAAQRALAGRNRRSGATVRSLQKKQGEHELQMLVFSDYHGARFEEFGTVKMAAIPFFFPPYRLLRKKIKSRVRSAIGKSVKDAIRGG